MPAKNRTLYTGSYKRRAAMVTDAAYADPSTTCRRCGKTLAEMRRSNPDERWDAGHLEDGNPYSPLVPEHSSCNRRAGAVLGNKRRALNSSRRWY